MANRPENKLLARAFPIEIWEQAEKQARRHALSTFNVGAVLVKDGKIVSRGCSHLNEGWSIHAEQDAIYGLPRHLTEGAEIIVVSVAVKSGSWPYSSRPCGRCAQYLDSRGVLFAHYAARDENGIWSVRTESIADIAEQSDDRYTLNTLIPARKMKVKKVEAFRVIAS